MFSTVLTEFEKFLDHYFENENQASKRGVSLAQQVEQRVTLAIQYTIELRKLIANVPIHDGVREFLFQVWADVLAVTAMRNSSSFRSRGCAGQTGRWRAPAGTTAPAAGLGKLRGIGIPRRRLRRGASKNLICRIPKDGDLRAAGPCAR